MDAAPVLWMLHAGDALLQNIQIMTLSHYYCLSSNISSEKTSERSSNHTLAPPLYYTRFVFFFLKDNSQLFADDSDYCTSNIEVCQVKSSFAKS